MPHEEKTIALVSKSSFALGDVYVDQHSNVASILCIHTQAWTHTKEVITRPSECIMISHYMMAAGAQMAKKKRSYEAGDGEDNCSCQLIMK